MLHKISAENLRNLICKDKKTLNGAPITMRSKSTGKDYTFRISQVPFKESSYIHTKVETQYLNFRYMGYYKEGKMVRRNRDTNRLEEVKTPAAEAVAWFLRQLMAEKFGFLDSNVDIFHIGKCMRCGKPLTDANSIEIGFGPVCRNK